MNMQVAAWGPEGPRVVAALRRKPLHLHTAGNEGRLQGSLCWYQKNLLPEQVHQAGALGPRATSSHSDPLLPAYSGSRVYLH